MRAGKGQKTMAAIKQRNGDIIRRDHSCINSELLGDSIY